MTALHVCAGCGLAFDDDPHTGDEDGEDYHADCCPDCNPDHPADIYNGDY